MYTYSIKCAQILNKYSNLNVTVESTAGTPTTIEGVFSGLMEFGGPGDIGPVTFAYQGKADWEGKPNKNLRLLANLGGWYQNWITNQDTGIKTVSDLRGKVIPYYTRGRANWVYLDAMMMVYGLDPRKDFTEIEIGGTSEARDDLIMGRIDAQVMGTASRNLLPIQEAIGKIVFVPFDRDKIIEARQKYPEMMVGKFPGVVTPEYLAGIQVDNAFDAIVSPRMLYTAKDKPDEIAYTIVKTMIEHDAEYRQVITDFTPENAALKGWGVPQVPWHPGAVKAFKELGLWDEEKEQAQKALLAAE